MSTITPFSGRRAVRPGDVPVLPGTSAAVAGGGLVFTGSMLPMGEDHRLAAAAGPDPDAIAGVDVLERQSEILLGHLRTTLAAAGCDVGSDVLRIYQWAPAIYRPDEDAHSDGVWPRFHPADGYVRVAARTLDRIRTSTGIGVRQLPAPGALFAVEVMAAEPRPDIAKQGFEHGDKERVLPFVGTLRHGDWVTASAGPSDFKGDWMSGVSMGEPSFLAPEARPNPYLWLGTEIEAQTEYLLTRLAAAAELAGVSLDRCVYADVTLTHASDYEGFERVWRRWFPQNPPARNLATGARLVIKGGRVEVSGLFLAHDSDLRAERIEVDGVATVGHAPVGVRAGELLFVSALLPLDADLRVPAHLREDPSQPYLSRPARAQSQWLLRELGSICDAAGTTLSEVCKVQAFLSDLSVLPEFLDEWRVAFPDEPPALAAMGMGGVPPLLAPHAMVQFSAIVRVPRQISESRSGL